MPNPSELERQYEEAQDTHVVDAEQNERLDPRYRRLWWLDRQGERLRERIAIWFAWRLPRRVALWAMIRVASHATTGRWGHESPSGLTYDKMHDRWNQDTDRVIRG